jgi:hypothetical protein
VKGRRRAPHTLRFAARRHSGVHGARPQTRLPCPVSRSARLARVEPDPPRRSDCGDVTRGYRRRMNGPGTMRPAEWALNGPEQRKPNPGKCEKCLILLAGVEGLEPPTPGFGVGLAPSRPVRPCPITSEFPALLRLRRQPSCGLVWSSCSGLGPTLGPTVLPRPRPSSHRCRLPCRLR